VYIISINNAWKGFEKLHYSSSLCIFVPASRAIIKLQEVEPMAHGIGRKDSFGLPDVDTDMAATTHS